MPRVEGAQRSVRIRRRTPIRGQHKGAGDPCKIVAVGALPTVSTNLFPSRLTVRRPAVNRSIVVRFHGGEPIAAFVYWLGYRPLGPVKWDRYHTRLQFLPVAQPDERRATDAEDAGSTPVGKANHQGVGEPSRPRLPWKQENVGANPTTLTIRCPLAQWQSGRF